MKNRFPFLSHHIQSQSLEVTTVYTSGVSFEKFFEITTRVIFYLLFIMVKKNKTTSVTNNRRWTNDASIYWSLKTLFTEI